MKTKYLSLNEIYAVFDTMPEFCPVCGERLSYGVAYHPKSDFMDIFIFCDSGEVYPSSIRHDCIEKRDIEYLMFQLCNSHASS